MRVLEKKVLLGVVDIWLEAFSILFASLPSYLAASTAAFSFPLVASIVVQSVPLLLLGGVLATGAMDKSFNGFQGLVLDFFGQIGFDSMFLWLYRILRPILFNIITQGYLELLFVR